MMKALWLTSWYPNKLDAQNGDFIQRHALAASLFCNVHVIHLEADVQNKLSQQTEVTVTKNNNLVEEIVLYKLRGQKGVIGKLSAYRRYVSIFKKHIEAYIKQNGKPDIVHVHVPVKAGMLALWIKRKYKIPYLVTEHWAIYNNDAPDAFFKRNVLFKYFTKKILQHAALFTPVSQNLGEAVQKMVVKVPFTVVPNVVDITLFNRQGRPQQTSDEFTFIHASTLNYQKNPEGILRAYKQFLAIHPGAKLVMVGGAGRQLLSYTTSLNIPPSNIQFTGFVTYKQVAELMRKSDALIMFSRYENLPCVITEALCCGLPVISTSVGGIPEVIEESNGLLVEKNDETALLQAMLQVFENRKAFNGHNIAARATAAFSYETIGKNLTMLYSSVG